MNAYIAIAGFIWISAALTYLLAAKDALDIDEEMELIEWEDE